MTVSAGVTAVAALVLGLLVLGRIRERRRHLAHVRRRLHGGCPALRHPTRAVARAGLALPVEPRTRWVN